MKLHDYLGHGTYAAVGNAVISCQVANLFPISWRYFGARSRWRLGRKRWAMGPYAARKRCACPGDLNPCMRRSRWRVGWCEFSARLFK